MVPFFHSKFVRLRDTGWWILETKSNKNDVSYLTISLEVEFTNLRLFVTCYYGSLFSIPKFVRLIDTEWWILKTKSDKNGVAYLTISLEVEFTHMRLFVVSYYGSLF